MRLFFAFILLCSISCEQAKQEANKGNEAVTSAEAIDSVSYVKQIEPIVRDVPEYGAFIDSYQVLTTENLDYKCKITISNMTNEAIKGVELIDYQGGGGMPTAYNLRRSVKPLQKIKLAIAPKSKATTTLQVQSSRVNPKISKIFYKDGTIHHTEYDVIGDQVYYNNNPIAKPLTSHSIKQSTSHNAVEDYYKETDKLLEHEKIFVQEDVNQIKTPEND